MDEDRAELEFNINLALKNTKPHTMAKLYEYCESVLKYELKSSEYQLQKNNMNNTLTLFIDSTNISTDNLRMMFEILNKN